MLIARIDLDEGVGVSYSSMNCRLDQDRCMMRKAKHARML